MFSLCSSLHRVLQPNKSWKRFPKRRQKARQPHHQHGICMWDRACRYGWLLRSLALRCSSAVLCCSTVLSLCLLNVMLYTEFRDPPLNPCPPSHPSPALPARPTCTYQQQRGQLNSTSFDPTVRNLQLSSAAAGSYRHAVKVHGLSDLDLPAGLGLELARREAAQQAVQVAEAEEERRQGDDDLDDLEEGEFGWLRLVYCVWMI